MLLIEPGIERLFTWDDAKNEINVKKHGISFEKASDVFSDPHALSRVERIENGEERWQTIGMVGEILLSTHCGQTPKIAFTPKKSE